MPAPFRLENWRLALLGAAFVLLLLAAGALMVHPSSPDDEIRRRILNFIAAFEDRDREEMLSYIRDPLNLSINDEIDHLSHEQVARRAEDVWQRLEYIDVQPQNIAIEVRPEEGFASAKFDFDWSVSSTLYPNSFITNARYNPNGEAEEALFTFFKDDGRWRIAEVYLVLRSR